MKIKITLKDPDGVYNAITDAAAAHVAATTQDLSEDETEALESMRGDAISEALSPWIEHSEYVVIEIDTDAKTAVVLPVRQ